jgi:transposase
MSVRKDILPDNIDELKEIIFSLQNNYTELQNKYQSAQEEIESIHRKYKAALAKYFSPTKEKVSLDQEGQLGLFNECETFTCEDEKEITTDKEKNITVKEYERKKGGKRKLPDYIPVEEHIHELSDSERECKYCGKMHPVIGEERTEELDIIPMQIKKVVHITKKYGPCSCDEFLNSGEKEIIKAEKPKRIIPYSFVSPGLLAYVIDMKYNYALPFYRLSKKFEAIETDISRATLCNWSMLAAEKCNVLYQAMLDYIKNGSVIQMDETSVQVLNEEGRNAETKSFMWVMRGGDSGKKLTLFHYSPTRNSGVPLDLLNGFKGFLQTDGYEGYSKSVVEYGLTHVGCLAHIRRKFFEALKSDKKSKTAAHALKIISRIYSVERKLRDENFLPDEFVKKRKDEVVPILGEFKTWLDEKQIYITPSSDSGKAVNYALGQWNNFINYLETEELTPDNNIIENAIRPFVVGRKNWLFSNTPRGAKSSAVLYSLVESAKDNSLNVYNYLRFLFSKLPYAKSSDEINNLLPCNLTADMIKITG